MLFMTVATSEYSEAKVLESLLARIAKGDKSALGELYGAPALRFSALR